MITQQVLHKSTSTARTRVKAAATTSTTPPEMCCRSSPKRAFRNVVQQSGDPQRRAAAAGGGDAGRGRLRAEPGCPGTGRAGGVPRPVREGDAGQPAAAAGGGHGDAVGCGGFTAVP